MTIRNCTILFFLSFFASGTVYGQQKDVKSYAVSKIQKIYQRINKYKNYKIVTVNDGEEFLGHSTDNGGSLKGYYQGDSLKKIVEWIGLSNKIIQNEYYFDNNKLVFVYSNESMYKFNERSQNFDYSKLDNIFKGRYYFEDEKLINTILSDSDRNETKEEDATAFLSSGKEYMTLLKAKKK